jgi:hypothetical protein
VDGVSAAGTIYGNDLTFTTLPTLATWRQTYFPGSTASTGPGSDTATPMNDGVCNLIKFAMGMDPTQPGAMPGTTSQNGNVLSFIYTPSAAAVAAGVTFIVEYSDTLLPGSWKSDIVNQGTIGAGGVPVTATVPAPASGPRFMHLKVGSPN